MRDSDALDNNPHISRAALEAIHSQVYGWALSRCDFDHATAEDLMQQAYVELLSGNARNMWVVVQGIAVSHTASHKIGGIRWMLI